MLLYRMNMCFFDMVTSESCCTSGNLCYFSYWLFQLSLLGLHRPPVHWLVTSVLCAHSGLENLKAQGSHSVSGQSTLVLNDPHSDLGFCSLSPAWTSLSFRRCHCVSPSCQALLGRSCSHPFGPFAPGTGVHCEVPQCLVCSMLNQPQLHRPSSRGKYSSSSICELSQTPLTCLTSTEHSSQMMPDGCWADGITLAPSA